LFPRIGRATRSPQKQHAPLCAGFFATQHSTEYAVLFVEPRLGSVIFTRLLTLVDEAADRIARHPVEPRPFAE
jgi:hypothetical protein